MKKFLSMLLCVAMVLSLCAVTFAADVTAELVTDASTLKAGDRVVIMNQTGEFAMGIQSGKYRTKVDKIASNGSVTVTADMAILTLEVGTEANTFAFKASDGYLVYNSGSGNAMHTATTKDASASWEITIEDGLAVVRNVGTNDRLMQYNASSPRFACYTGSQQKLMIFKMGEGTPDAPEVVVPATLAEQIAEANQLSNGAYLAYESTITGEITDDPAESTYTAGTYKFTVSDGTNSLLCYYTPVTGGTPAKGDTVTVTGKLTAYNGAAQFNSTASATIVKKGENEQPEQPEQPETPAISAVANPVAGTAYKFALQQNGLSNKPVLGITGAMNGYYYATTETVTEMVDVYLEAVTGGYHIYFMDGATKTYLDIIPRENDATKTNVVFQTTGEHTVYVLNTEFQYVMTTVNGTDWYLGTFGTNKTISASKTSYISDTSKIGVSQFCAWFYAAEGTAEPTPDPNAEAAAAVDALIDAIGEVTLEKDAAIIAAREAYEALSAEGKALVTKLDVLTAAETQLAALKKAAEDKAAADAVVDQIAALGEITLESKAAIDAARAAFNALTDDQKALVTNEATLQAAEAKLQALQEQADKEAVDKAAAAGAEALIDAIGEVTLEKETAITAARAAYEALTADQKALVTKLDTLTAAETELAALKEAAAQAAADKKAADAVAAMINKIGTVTKDSEAAIEAARAAYDALTDAQKALVENYETLTSAEEAFKGIANTGDSTVLFVMLAMLSMTALVVLVSKKRVF